MPSSKGSARLPMVSVQSQVARHRGLIDLPRYSNDTPRIMRASSTSIMARYRAENMLAYHRGKAAKVAAAATMSQTSLPSQNGPMLLMATRRSRSVRPDHHVEGAHAHVEALQDEKAGPEEGDDDEPEDL